MHGRDIKSVWTNWRREPSKTAIAEALWPVLRERLDAAATDSTVEPPPVAVRLLDAFHHALQRPRGRFLLHGTAWPGDDHSATSTT
jgi:hypothetical protein